MVALEAKRDECLRVPVEYLVEGKREAFIAGAEAMHNEILSALGKEGSVASPRPAP